MTKNKTFLVPYWMCYMSYITFNMTYIECGTHIG